jgi:hypothetical protein
MFHHLHRSRSSSLSVGAVIVVAALVAVIVALSGGPGHAGTPPAPFIVSTSTACPTPATHVVDGHTQTCLDHWPGYTDPASAPPGAPPQGSVGRMIPYSPTPTP